MGGYPRRCHNRPHRRVRFHPMATGDRVERTWSSSAWGPADHPVGVRWGGGRPRDHHGPVGRCIGRRCRSAPGLPRVPEPLRRPAELGRVARCPTGPFTQATCFASVLDRAGRARLMRRGPPLRINMIFFWGVCCRARRATEGSSHRLSRPGARIRALDCGRGSDGRRRGGGEGSRPPTGCETAADGSGSRGRVEVATSGGASDPPPDAPPPIRRRPLPGGGAAQRARQRRTGPPSPGTQRAGQRRVVAARQAHAASAGAPLLAGGGTASNAAAARPAARRRPLGAVPPHLRRPARRAGRAPPGYRRTCDRR